VTAEANYVTQTFSLPYRGFSTCSSRAVSNQPHVSSAYLGRGTDNSLVRPVLLRPSINPMIHHSN
jgi:hypothetical protein